MHRVKATQILKLQILLMPRLLVCWATELPMYIWVPSKSGRLADWMQMGRGRRRDLSPIEVIKEVGRGSFRGHFEGYAH